ncbi:butyrophilin-like protein 8 isoform X2 [Cheilinus undulatus]|uniref:butyrophilin-like protein 8 isoform X2 n=1 Tax=Cheilinus undulatus TaxID=241271 RepID=UPI001BD341A2|nr:butyrophilin-like protein 8 isoform X2 [Cheilinus undulatus]
MKSFFGWIFLTLWTLTTSVMALPRVEVNEDDDAVLPCLTSPEVDIESAVIHWKTGDGQEVYFYDNGDYSGKGSTGHLIQFDGRVSHFQDKLKNGNASIKITKTRIEDNGIYTCILPKLQPSQEYQVQLVVNSIFKDRTGENPLASPKPSIEVISQTLDWALLQCQVQGAFPKPSLKWQDGSGEIHHTHGEPQPGTGGKYDMTVQVTVRKTGHYHCVLRQEELKHEISVKTFVLIPEKECQRQAEVSSNNSNAGWFVGGCLFGVGLVVVVLLLALWFIHPFRFKVINVLSELNPRQDKLNNHQRDQNERMIDHRAGGSYENPDSYSASENGKTNGVQIT